MSFARVRMALGRAALDASIRHGRMRCDRVISVGEGRQGKRQREDDARDSGHQQTGRSSEA